MGMQLNADFSARVAVHAARLPWVPSPTAGVERRMLDRIGDEVARATSIVRYASDSRFPAHTHGGGEEFYVLDGIFQDEHGEYPAGWYIRNPPTSAHTPGSRPGCVLFVKLWQFAPDDRRHVRIDTNTLPFQRAPDRADVELKALHSDADEDVRLEQWKPNATIELAIPRGAELLVLNGSFTEGGDSFLPQSWLRLPPGYSLRATAGDEGCTLWVKTGHLTSIRTLAP